MSLLKIIMLCVVLLFAEPTTSLSCYGGHVGCIGSCQVQNCATGYCVGPPEDPSKQTCVCSRCGSGPPW